MTPPGPPLIDLPARDTQAGRSVAGIEQAERELLGSSLRSDVALALEALELTPPSDPARCSRALIAVDALVADSRLAEASELAAAVVAGAGVPSIGVARLRVRLSELLVVTGESGAAVSEAEAVLALPDLPDQLRASAELARLLGLVSQDDAGGARGPAEAILAGGSSRAADLALAGALAALGFIAWDEGHVDDGVGLLRAAVRRAESVEPETGPLVHPALGLASMLAAVGEFDAGEGVIGEARAALDRAGSMIWATAPELFLARLHLAAGRIEEASIAARLGLLAAETSGERGLIPLARATLASVALLRGELDEAARQVEQCRAEPAGRWAGSDRVACTWIEARVVDAREGAVRAAELVAGILDDPHAHTRLFMEEPAAAAWLTRIALAVDDRGRAERVVACAVQLAKSNPGCRPIEAAAAHARGLLDHDASSLQRAAAHHCHPWARAAALEDAGVVLAAAGDRTAAHSELERALEAYEEVGAELDTRRVRARLRDLTTGRRRGWRTERPVSGWASLTPTECKVAEHVTESLTNRQIGDRMFLSRHTVDFHLRQVFRKLAVNSRVELVRLAIEESKAS